MGNAHGRTPSGLNLIKEAKNFYDLIQEFNFTPQLFQKIVAEEALRRYEVCWLPLVADYPEVRLIAPLDIELIWIVHMHNPTAYLADCKQFYGKGFCFSLKSFTKFLFQLFKIICKRTFKT